MENSKYKKLGLLALVIGTFYLSPSIAIATEDNTSNEPSLSYSLASGNQFILVISNVDGSEIDDLKLDGISVLDKIQHLIKNGNIVFISNEDNEYFLKIKSPELSESLVGKQFILVLKSGVEVSFPKIQPNNEGNTQRRSSPEVDIYGTVYHCVRNPSYTGGFWEWRNPSMYVRLKGAKISATMGGQSDSSYTSWNGRYHLGYSKGHCKNSFNVKAVHPSTRKYKTSSANVGCWGWDSDDTVNFTFANGFSNDQGVDKCGEY